ncbi:MAG: helical backbone metal receptor [Bacteroidetes bacterium]|nr:helical backbone metal receptor [Bacteroidota bacterium]
MRQVCLLCLLLIGCSSNFPEGRTVEDDLGRTVVLPPTIERIATLAPSVTELAFAAGAGSKIVGVTTFDDYPPAVDSLPKYGMIPTDFEAIVALDPELVLASEQVNSPKEADIFSSIGIPVYFVAVNTLPDVPRAIRTLGDLLGTSEAATRRAIELEDSLAQLAVLTADLSERPRTLFLINDVTLYAFGQGSYIHDMIDLAGGYSITQTLTTRAPVLTDEFVLSSGPDVIVGSFGPQYDVTKLISHHSTWDIVPAVVSGRIYGLYPDLYLRPGPRLVSGAWTLAQVLHPDAVINP